MLDGLEECCLFNLANALGDFRGHYSDGDGSGLVLIAVKASKFIIAVCRAILAAAECHDIRAVTDTGAVGYGS